MPGIPQFKEKNKKKETIQKQSAMLEEVVKVSAAPVWLPPLGTSALTHVHILHKNSLHFFEECRRHVGFGDADVDSGKMPLGVCHGTPHRTHHTRQQEHKMLADPSRFLDRPNLRHLLSALTLHLTAHEFSETPILQQTEKKSGEFWIGIDAGGRISRICEFLALILEAGIVLCIL